MSLFTSSYPYYHSHSYALFFIIGLACVFSPSLSSLPPPRLLPTLWLETTRTIIRASVRIAKACEQRQRWSWCHLMVCCNQNQLALSSKTNSGALGPLEGGGKKNSQLSPRRWMWKMKDPSFLCSAIMTRVWEQGRRRGGARGAHSDKWGGW